jgi:hypothetical protein
MATPGFDDASAASAPSLAILRIRKIVVGSIP